MVVGAGNSALGPLVQLHLRQIQQGALNYEIPPTMKYQMRYTVIATSFNLQYFICSLTLLDIPDIFFTVIFYSTASFLQQSSNLKKDPSLWLVASLVKPLTH